MGIGGGVCKCVMCMDGMAEFFPSLGCVIEWRSFSLLFAGTRGVINICNIKSNGVYGRVCGCV